jgi:hypothetical protein
MSVAALPATVRATVKATVRRVSVVHPGGAGHDDTTERGHYRRQAPAAGPTSTLLRPRQGSSGDQENAGGHVAGNEGIAAHHMSLVPHPLGTRPEETLEMGLFSDVNYDAITKQNSKNLEKTENGRTIPFRMTQDVIVIGTDGHADTIRWLDQHRGIKMSAAGQVTVTKPKGTDPGTLTVDGGAMLYHRNFFTDEIRKFSKKTKIVYV